MIYELLEAYIPTVVFTEMSLAAYQHSRSVPVPPTPATPPPPAPADLLLAGY